MAEGSENRNAGRSPVVAGSDRSNAWQDMLDAVMALWPSSTIIEGASGARSWVVLPSKSRPRLLVPNAPRAAKNAMRRYSAALGPLTSLARAASAWGVGATVYLPVLDRVSIADAPDGGIDDFLSETFGEQVTVALGIGPVRANRKPVLAIFSQDGRPLGFAKIGHTEVSARHVSGEAANLAVLSSRKYRTFRHPKVIRFDPWREMPVLVITALQASAWQGFRGRWKLPHTAIRELASAFGTETVPLREMPFWQRAFEGASRLGDPSIRTRVQSCLAAMDEIHGDVVETSGAWHGDLTPWNLAWAGEAVEIWDWERFELGVPVGFDTLHYAAQTNVTERGFSVENLIAGMRRVLSSEVSESPIAASYLMSLSLRYLSAAQEPGGHSISGKALVALEAWECLLGIRH